VVKVLKIGGSILTDKTRAACARNDEIDRVAAEIAKSWKDLIFIHGAGSFGHVPARKYGLPEVFDPAGLLETHSCVVKLNGLVVDALAKAGAYPMPVHPFSCTLLRDGRIERLPVAPIAEMVRRGLLPVLHGDVAMDTSRGAGIVSGDQLLSYIAKALKAEVVASGTIEDGVMAKGRTLKEITRDDLPAIGSDLGGSSGVDATGGMKGKVLELLDLADDGIDSQIFNASKDGMIIRALSGEPLGTGVRRSR
jgi:isopentenyl phosphate kinase